MLHDEYVRDMPAPGARTPVGSVLIPFSPGRSMQGQVVPLSRTGYRLPLSDDSSPMPLGQIGILAWYAAKDIQYRDAVEFSATERDFYDMPAMTIHYTITDVDRETLAQQRANVERSAKVVGELLTEPAFAAGGSSLHYQGTVRMGLADDGESVCDPYAAGSGPPLRRGQRVDPDGHGRQPHADECRVGPSVEGSWPPSSNRSRTWGEL